MAHWQLGNKEEAANGTTRRSRGWTGTATNDEVGRFRAEAEELLKITDKKPTTKLESK